MEALVTDCPVGRLCNVGRAMTDALGAFALRVDADVDAQLGRQPGESSALFVQARLDGVLLATATVCWIEDMPAGRAVELELVAARAWPTREAAAPPALELAEPLNLPADSPPMGTISPRTLPSLPVVEALRWV